MIVVACGHLLAWGMWHYFFLCLSDLCFLSFSLEGLLLEHFLLGCLLLVLPECDFLYGVAVAGSFFVLHPLQCRLGCELICKLGGGCICESSSDFLLLCFFFFLELEEVFGASVTWLGEGFSPILSTMRPLHLFKCLLSLCLDLNTVSRHFPHLKLAH